MVCYKKEKVTIIGLGITGLSCINFFLSRSVIPKIIDTRISPPNVKKLPLGLKYWFGSINQSWLLESTLIVVSPGIKLYHPSIITAMQYGIEIVNDIELFVREITAPVIAITGSNGKSTVTQLLNEITMNLGWKIGVGGNIGLPVLTLLEKSYQLYILELSSFQLEITKSLRATIAVILNIEADHMDHYPNGIKEYQNAKLKIYKKAKICIFNADDKLTFPSFKHNNKFISFSKYSGKYRLYHCNSQIWLMAKNKLVINCSKLKINGLHNYINALVVLIISDILQISRAFYCKIIKQFYGLAHRFQLVYCNNGVKWINDSKSTNVSSTKAALNSITINRGTLHLLLGGDGKFADFSKLAPYVKSNKIKLYCFGKDGNILKKLKPESSIYTKTLEEAMFSIKKEIKKEDIVLLSPACSSLDQFNNFEDRGDFFTRLAKIIG